MSQIQNKFKYFNFNSANKLKYHNLLNIALCSNIATCFCSVAMCHSRPLIECSSRTTRLTFKSLSKRRISLRSSWGRSQPEEPLTKSSNVPWQKGLKIPSKNLKKNKLGTQFVKKWLDSLPLESLPTHRYSIRADIRDKFMGFKRKKKRWAWIKTKKSYLVKKKFDSFQQL